MRAATTRTRALFAITRSYVLLFLFGLAPAGWFLGSEASLTLTVAAHSVPESPPQVGDLGEWFIKISSKSGPVSMAIPDFDSVGGTAADASKTLSDVVWSDMEFASIYQLVDKERYEKRQGPRKESGIDYHHWEENGADILIEGTAEVVRGRLISEVRIYAVKAQEMVFGKRYEATQVAARDMAHRIADDILQQAGNYKGVSRTKIAFTSNRDGQGKSIYLMDYDGFNQHPIVANGSLNLMPAWAPDGKAIAYISYRTGVPSIHRKFIFEGREELLETGDGMALSPSWSPDGSRILFSSTRDGNMEIYLMNADGSDVRRLSFHPSIDTSPCWSPTGTQIAFTSDRTGSPQIYVMDTEGLNLRRISFQGSYNDAPTWSPSSQFNEIAFASRIERGPFDIAVYSFNTGQTRQLTTRNGSNEDPAWSPNGRHLVFTSTRSGSEQVYLMNRDGSNQRRLVGAGNNTTPRWGPIPNNRHGS